MGSEMCIRDSAEERLERRLTEESSKIWLKIEKLRSEMKEETLLLVILPTDL